MQKRPVWLIGSISTVCLAPLSVGFAPAQAHAAPKDGNPLDGALAVVLRQAGFTGRIAATLEQRLGRRIDPNLAEIGRLL
jgi:hypothetical protein